MKNVLLTFIAAGQSECTSVRREVHKDSRVLRRALQVMTNSNFT